MLSGFNFMSHGSQDLFPTMLKKQIGLGKDALTVTNVVVNLGAVIGGIFWGQCSELVGRRLAVIFCCIGGGAFLYGTFFKHDQSSIMGFGFMLQFFVMGAWGVMPIHLTELCAKSPLRTLISGTAYQLGNLASSASSTIESQLGDKFPLPEKGKDVYDYGKVMCIFMGCVFGYLLLVMFFGPESFHQEIKTDYMIQEEDIDKKYELDQVMNPIPHSHMDEKLINAIHQEHAYEEEHAEAKTGKN
ncbi:unnamed protein product [Ambrosiozyma monospora]|uniref:Unnamed protein product n=2 Tax=Ambrosiozyma monospora TaxID=43982 RepID=A0A9W6T4A0_AMBMO|nr:unnamed protein product [Ambrosiozyma monospora]